MNSIVEAVAKFATERPERTAVIANDCKITYKELWKEIQGFAKYIKSFDFPQASRIIIKSDSDIWFAVACFAIHLTGNVHIPLEKTIGANGLEAVAEELGASMVIANVEVNGDFVLVNSE